MSETGQNPLHNLMLRDVSKVQSANCVLSRLWRLSLLSLEVEAPIWDALLTNYIRACREHITKAKANNLKGNLPKGLASETVTWDCFCTGLSVFDFADVIFCLTLDDGDKVENVSVHIPRVLGGDPGFILAALFEKVNKAFPDKLSAWYTLLDDYIVRAKAAGENIPEHLKGGLTRALSKEKLTWSMFYRGLMVHNYVSIGFSLKLKRRKHKDYDVINLNLRRAI